MCCGFLVIVTHKRQKDSCLFKIHIGADETAFESEKPGIFSLEEIEEATDYFDETRKIGVGGFGSVYFGVMGEKVCKGQGLNQTSFPSTRETLT